MTAATGADAVFNLRGDALDPQDYVALQARWISQRFADLALLRRVDSSDWRGDCGPTASRWGLFGNPDTVRVAWRSRSAGEPSPPRSSGA